MNKRIIYKTVDGGVGIIIPAVSIEACMKDIPENAEYQVVDVVDIPADRTFRAAWEYAE